MGHLLAPFAQWKARDCGKGGDIRLHIICLSLLNTSSYILILSLCRTPSDSLEPSCILKVLPQGFKCDFQSIAMLLDFCNWHTS